MSLLPPITRAAVLACALAGALSATASPPSPLAFPGAQGFGAHAVGGRGGDVYHVTNLVDGGPGTLREAIGTALGPRTIVFDVGGTIELSGPLVIRGSRLTIAGQSAPGGIGLSGYPLVVDGVQDVVIRYLRLRPGDRHAAGVPGRPGRGRGDLAGDSADALSIVGSERVVIDHVSASWGMDETLSVTQSNHVTVQHSIIAESLNDSFHPEGPHGYGSLVRGQGGGGYTFFGNLWAHHMLRSPAVGGEQHVSPLGTRRGLDVDLVNNVVYDWGFFPSHNVRGLGRLRMNYVSNVLVAGTSTFCTACVFVYLDPEPGDDLEIFPRDNWIDMKRDGAFDPVPAQSVMFAGGPALVALPLAFARPELEALPAQLAYDRVVREAGASLVRDAVDRRIIRQLVEGSGGLIDSQDEVGGWPDDPPRRPALEDSDRDGMPDAWERRRHLDPSDPSDRNRFDLGRPYTNLEVYLHELANPDAGRHPHDRRSEKSDDDSDSDR